MLNAKLVVVGGGDAKVSEISLKLPATIGRSRKATVKLPHPLVSRRHCEVFERDGRLFVRDLGSLNGTYVDSHKIDADQALHPDHLLTLGTVTFRAVYEPQSVLTPVQANSKADPSERPTDKSPALPAATIGQSEPDEPRADTDKQPASFEVVDFGDAGHKQIPEPVASSVFVDVGRPTGHSSISLSEIARLPGQAAPLSFAGGIQVDGAAAPAEATPEPFPGIQELEPGARKVGGSRPR
jgi:predicted component of type VI protein secretion system